MRMLSHIFRAARFPFLVGWTDEGEPPRMPHEMLVPVRIGRQRALPPAAGARIGRHGWAAFTDPA